MPQQHASNIPANDAGRNKSVPVFYEGQNCQVPSLYVTREEADKRKAAGLARAINHGKAILMLKQRAIWRPHETTAVAVREIVSRKTRWAVVGQTRKPFSDKHSLGTLDEKLSTPDKPVYRKPPPGPGCPRYALV